MGGGVSGLNAGVNNTVLQRELQRSSQAAGAEKNEAASSAVNPQAPNAAPAHYTIPAALSSDSLDQARSPDEVAAQISQNAQDAADLDAEPQQQGFFKGLMSKALSFIKENAGMVATGALLFAVTVGTGGAAAVVPALWGLATGGAMMGAVHLLVKDLKQTPAEEEPLSPQRFEEQERIKELERKLEEMEKRVGQAGQAPASSIDDLLQLGSKPAVAAAATETDLLGMHEASEKPQ